MTNVTATNYDAYSDIARIIHGKPAAPLSHLPGIWQDIAKTGGQTKLTDKARQDYVEAAQLFRYHDTPMGPEALTAIAQDFEADAYPDFDNLTGDTELARKTIDGVKALFAEFGYQVPASLYNVILATIDREDQNTQMAIFRQESVLKRDRVWDAVIHAMLLVTPIGLKVHSILSQHGVRFSHVMACSCITSISIDAPFEIELDSNLKPAYVQNMIAAAFEQYGVNAATSGQIRGY